MRTPVTIKTRTRLTIFECDHCGERRFIQTESPPKRWKQSVNPLCKSKTLDFCETCNLKMWENSRQELMRKEMRIK